MTVSHMVPDAYVRKALDDECQFVALAREGRRNNTLNTAAYSVGQLVGAGGLDRSIAEDALTGAARRCGLPDSEAAATIRSGLDAGQGEPRDLSHLGADQHRRDPDRNETPTGTAAPSAGSRGGDSEEWALVTSRASEYRPEPVEFLDGGMLPKKLITIAGLGSAGKGMFWANVVADLTRGRPTLVMTYQAPGPIDVLLVGCEDGYSDTVIPRLMAADADLNRVHILNCIRDSKGHVHPFSLAYLKLLEDYPNAHPGIGLVVIDPIAGYVGRAGVKDHHDADVRSVLEPLGDLANRRKITILTTKHLNKDEAKTVASRVGGSVAYVNVSRACFVVATDPENETRRVLAPFKWNLNAPRPPSIAWTMEPIPPDLVATILAGCDHLSDEDKGKLATQLHRLAWAGKVDADADDLLRAAARSERKSHQNEVDRATEWLRQRLADGPVGSVLCAREGDKAMGRPWPTPDPKVPPDDQRKRVLARVKWWRETILKKRLEGETARAGYNGPYFFRLPDHITRRLWPPTSEAIRVPNRQTTARHALPRRTNHGPPPWKPWKPWKPWRRRVGLRIPRWIPREGKHHGRAMETSSPDPWKPTVEAGAIRGTPRLPRTPRYTTVLNRLLNRLKMLPRTPRTPRKVWVRQRTNQGQTSSSATMTGSTS